MKSRHNNYNKICQQSFVDYGTSVAMYNVYYNPPVQALDQTLSYIFDRECTH